MNKYMRLSLVCTAAYAAFALVGCGKEKLDEEKSAELIQPVGRIEFASSAPVTSTADAKPKTGDEIVKTVCSACHGTGLNGSPKIGDKTAWGPRIAQGKDALYKSALNGKNNMPPRGGTQLSDAEIKSAVDYLVAQVK